VDGAGAIAVRDAALCDAALGSVPLGSAAGDGDEPGSDAFGVGTVPRAAGIDRDGRGADDEAPREAEAGLGGGDGASIAITTERPTNPIATAAMPYTSRVLSDRPGRPDRLE
jgi:hypothetical protein